MSTLNRTDHCKYVTYTGDGSGRDHYVVFNNGGLHGLRDYRGQQYNGFNLGPLPTHAGVTPRKDETAVDYIPDGTGRDTYIIQAFGLKRDYKSSHREFEKGLRQEQGTPMMDALQLQKQMQRTNPLQIDATMYNNWPSQKAIKEERKQAKRQRESIERLSASPNRVSPMSKYLNKTATIDTNPQNKASNYLLARTSELRFQSDESASLQNQQVFSSRKSSLKGDAARLVFTADNGREQDGKPQQSFEAFFNQPIYKPPGTSLHVKVDDRSNLNKTQIHLKQGNLFSQTEEYERKNLLKIKQANQFLTPRVSVRNASFNPVYAATAFKTIKTNTDSLNRPRQFRSILSNKAPIGHNIRLDLVSNNKVVNNDFEKFFKQKAYAPLTIDTSKF